MQLGSCFDRMYGLPGGNLDYGYRGFIRFCHGVLYYLDQLSFDGDSEDFSDVLREFYVFFASCFPKQKEVKCEY